MKKNLKIDFTGFWPNFIKKDNYFYHLLSTKYEVEVDEVKPDLLFYSVDYSNKKEHLKNKYKHSKKIFYTGENKLPDFHFCDASFTFSTKSNDNNYRLPLWALFINWFDVPHKRNRDQSFLLKKESLLDNHILKKPNKFFCSFLATNPSGERVNFFPKLNQIKEVDSSGKLMNNSKKIIKGRGDQKWKLKYLSKYRFNIAFENEIGDGYVTEKIIHPMSVNSIPVYWGSDSVRNDFNVDSFIFLDDFDSYESAIDYIMTLENNNDLYLEKLNNPWFKDNKFPDYVLPDNVLGFIDTVL
tara:strand:+ start:14736 stop:15629 length:894 start_codon:yes stop_codon:yes gene_type:complete